MSSTIYIHSLFIKDTPVRIGKYLILIPDFWSDYSFENRKTDIGVLRTFVETSHNKDLIDGDDLIVTSNDFFKVVKGSDMYTCFLASELSFFEVNYSNSIEKSVVNVESDNLVFVGWDVQNYFGSASIEDYYPIDPTTGKEINNDARMINQWGLIESYENSVYICEKNKILNSTGEWFSVAIYVDKYTYDKIIAI